MEKGFRALLVCWIVLLFVITAGCFSYNDHLDSLPGELPQHPPHCSSLLVFSFASLLATPKPTSHRSVLPERELKLPTVGVAASAAVQPVSQPVV